MVHGLVHLLERNNTERFNVLMDSFLPNQRVCRETPDHGILGCGVWGVGCGMWNVECGIIEANDRVDQWVEHIVRLLLTV